LDDLQPQWDITDYLLATARLYFIGDKYLIDELKKLSLDKSHDLLIKITLFGWRRLAIVKVIRYVYDNTRDRLGDNHPNLKNHRTLYYIIDNLVDDLRAMMIQYVGLHEAHFVDYGPHMELLEERGEYPADLFADSGVNDVYDQA